MPNLLKLSKYRTVYKEKNIESFRNMVDVRLTSVSRNSDFSNVIYAKLTLYSNREEVVFPVQLWSKAGFG